MKRLQGQLDFLETQESYVKDETKNLRRELLRAKEEVTRIQVRYCSLPRRLQPGPSRPDPMRSL